MKYIKVVLPAAILLLIVFVCMGSYSEISDYDIVSGMAIDRTDSGWSVVCEICVPSSDNDFGSSGSYISGSGESIAKALDNAGAKSSNVLYTGCNQLIVIGARAAGEKELYDYLKTDNVNLRAVTVIASGSAQEVLESDAEVENANVRADSLSVAKKIRRFCSENSKPLPRVSEYLRTGTAVKVSKNEFPVTEEHNR